MANGFDRMIKLTLLVCTHNNADLLDLALSSFTTQSAAHCDWEVIVVANNCTDDTLSLCERFQSDGQVPGLRIICESRQGVAFARKTGIRASRGEWVAFIDDDCRIADDWVARAIEFVGSRPEAGVVCGRNTLDWEIEPSDLHVAYGESFARQDWGEVARQAFSHNRELPCGAGMLLRRSVLLQSGYLELGQLTGRSPNRFSAGEDTESALFIAKRGWEVWYCSELNLKHFIPRQRMTLHYMCRIHHGFGQTEAYLRCLASEEGFGFSNRFRQLLAAFQELAALLRRFPVGFVYYRKERPTWCIRCYHTIGFIQGAIGNFFCGGRSNQENKLVRTFLHFFGEEATGTAGSSSGAVLEATDDPNRRAA